jgi:hypothetical protein
MISSPNVKKDTPDKKFEPATEILVDVPRMPIDGVILKIFGTGSMTRKPPRRQAVPPPGPMLTMEISLKPVSAVAAIFMLTCTRALLRTLNESTSMPSPKLTSETPAMKSEPSRITELA